MAKCSAVLMVLLIFLPFTRPCSTCRLSDLLGEVSTDHSPIQDGKITHDDATALAVMCPLVSTLTSTTVLNAIPRPAPLPDEIRPAALRL
jgi:hypothetical protein